MQPHSTLERAQPLYFLGDSHAVPFRHLLFEAAGGRQFLGLGKHLALTCLNIVTERGELNPRLLNALIAENLIERAASGLALVSHVEDPMLVVCCGETELRSMAAAFGPDADFIDPDAPAAQPDPHKRLIPFDLIHAELATRARQLGKALDLLRTLGFSRLSLHAIPPEQPPEGHPKGAPWQPSPTRRRLAAIFHRLLRAECLRSGARFIDVWDQVTREGELLPEYYLDGVHLHPRAARFSIAQLLAQSNGPAEVRLVGLARPIYFLGDASVECFRGIVHASGAAGAGYACKAHAIANFSFASALDSAGRMNQDFMQVLNTESMLIRNVESGALSPVRSHVGEGIFRAVGSAEDPAMVIASGELDVARIRASNADPGTCSDAALAGLIEPLLLGLALLRQMGFERIAILGLATRGCDAEETALRARLNSALERRACAAGLRFIAPPAAYEACAVSEILEAIVA